MNIVTRPVRNLAAVGRTPADVYGIVLHSSEGSLAGMFAVFDQAGGPSAHYGIDVDGTVYQMVDPAHVAFHVAAFGNNPGLNRNRPVWMPAYNGRYSATNAVTIGIELVGFAARGFSDSQYRSLGALCARLCRDWDLPPTLLPEYGDEAAIVTHGWLQTDRSDPGALFDWGRFGAYLAEALGEEAEDVGVIDELSRQVADLRAEIVGLQAQLQEAIAQRNDYAGQNQTRQEQIDALRQELGERQADVIRLSEALAAAPTEKRTVARLIYSDGEIKDVA